MSQDSLPKNSRRKERHWKGEIMRKRPHALLAVTSTALLALATRATLASASTQSNDAHALPISSYPTTDVNPKAPLTITLDPSNPNFNRFHEQFVKNDFSVLVDNQPAQATYDDSTYTITIRHALFVRYTNHTVTLSVKAMANNGHTASGNASDSFTFATGSAIGEATKISVSVASPSVSVDNGGVLSITATDDYNNPATGATVTVTGTGHFIAPADATITSGKASVPLNDHTAETVALTYTVKDNTYSNQADDTHTGPASEIFVPGALNADTSSVTVDKPTITAGGSVTVSVTPKDQFGNSLGDGQAVSANDGGPTVTTLLWNATNSDYEGPFTETKAPSITFTATVNDTKLNTTPTVTVNPGTPDASKSVVVFPTGSVVAGTAYTVTGTLKDQYGNIMPHKSVTLSFDGQTADVQSGTDGTFSVSVTPTKATTTAATVSADNVTLATTNSSVAPGAAANVDLSPTSTNVAAGDSDAFTGTVTDTYGNLTTLPDGTLVTLSASTGTVPFHVTMSGGQFTFNLFQDTTYANDVVTATISNLPTASSTLQVSGSVPSVPTDYMTNGYFMDTNTADANAWAPVYDLGQFGMGPWGNVSGWSDSAAHWMWGTPGANSSAAVGTTYNRRDFMLSSSATVNIAATADNRFALYVDGTQILAGTDWTKTVKTSSPLTLTAGLHTVVMVAKNDGGPAGFIVSAADSNGVLFDSSRGWYSTPSVPKTITLAPSSTTVTAGTADAISGTVIDQYGNPVPDGTSVTLTSSAGSVPQSVSTTGGQFSFTLSKDTQAGTDTVQASTANGVNTSTSVTVAPGAVNPNHSSVNFPTGSVAAGTAYTITGALKDQFGNGIPNQSVTLNFDGQTTTVTTGTDGSFSASVTPTQTATTATATVSAGSITLGTGNSAVTVGSAAKATLTVPNDLTAGTGATLTGVVTDTYGNPIANQTVTLTGTSYTTTTDAQGNYSLPFTPTASTHSLGLEVGAADLTLNGTPNTSIAAEVWVPVTIDENLAHWSENAYAGYTFTNFTFNDSTNVNTFQTRTSVGLWEQLMNTVAVTPGKSVRLSVSYSMPSYGYLNSGTPVPLQVLDNGNGQQITSIGLTANESNTKTVTFTAPQSGSVKLDFNYGYAADYQSFNSTISNIVMMEQN